MNVMRNTMMNMTTNEQAHIDTSYASVKNAMDELAQVLNKDKYLIQIQSALYKMEDMLYQYISSQQRRRAQ